MVGLYNKPGRGCKYKFNPEQEEKIKEFTKKEPRQLKQVLQKVEQEWGIKTSKKTVKRILKRLRMTWHRMCRAVGGKPETQIYQEKKAQLFRVIRLSLGRATSSLTTSCCTVPRPKSLNQSVSSVTGNSLIAQERIYDAH